MLQIINCVSNCWNILHYSICNKIHYPLPILKIFFFHFYLSYHLVALYHVSNGLFFFWHHFEYCVVVYKVTTSLQQQSPKQANCQLLIKKPLVVIFFMLFFFFFFFRLSCALELFIQYMNVKINKKGSVEPVL